MTSWPPRWINPRIGGLCRVPAHPPGGAGARAAPFCDRSRLAFVAGHDVDLVHLDVALQPHGRGLGGKAAAQLLRHDLHVRDRQAQFRGDLSVRQVQAHEGEAQRPDTQGLVMPGQDRAGQVIEALAAGIAPVALAMWLAIIMAIAHHRLAVAAMTLHLLRPPMLPHHGEALGVVQQS
ncbi:hypothetical protein Q7A36_30455 [Paracraurococcus sp. LOR1-02]|uniref:Uncharacterized protein n=1 Tax=Paracraurococcus lichenis TaxID=3064888 RepID=A0ABT9E959_9PROT|nr:hypothetical protein [Paracraurococcus sp. LOR1-02]MDO9712696.1 hypothetical protein [Paracraurococcus sp. LOR1-02]